MSQAWWHMPVTPALSKPGQEDIKCDTSLGYKVRPYLNKTNRKLIQLAIPFPCAGEQSQSLLHKLGNCSTTELPYHSPAPDSLS